MTYIEALEYADTLITKSAGEPRKEFVKIAKYAIAKQIAVDAIDGCPSCGKKFKLLDINACPYCTQALHWVK